MIPSRFNSKSAVGHEPMARSAAFRPQKRAWVNRAPNAHSLPRLLRRERRAPYAVCSGRAFLTSGFGFNPNSEVQPRKGAKPTKRARRD